MHHVDLALNCRINPAIIALNIQHYHIKCNATWKLCLSVWHAFGENMDKFINITLSNVQCIYNVYLSNILCTNRPYEERYLDGT
jgi:hypothetical protein